MKSPAPDPGLRPVERVTGNLETPSLDNRAYRVVLLSNQLEVLLVHDPDTDKASAAMDVNVGNFSDEDDMPGMAHAVEHLLFMGTKKYPVENAYSQYLSAHSGSSNAYTGSTSTNYFFDVAGKPSDDGEASESNPSPLHGALDRFAQFFIEPLFLASTLDRELCLSPNTIVRTTEGFKAIRDIAIGDQLFDDQDNPVQCLAAEAVQTSPDMKKVTYTAYDSHNKESFTCTSDHIMTLRAHRMKPIAVTEQAGLTVCWWTRCDGTEFKREAKALKWDTVVHELYTEVSQQKGRLPTDGEVRQYLKAITRNLVVPDSEDEGSGAEEVEKPPALIKLLDTLKKMDLDETDADTSMIRMVLQEHMEEYLEALIPELEEVPDNDDDDVIDLDALRKRKFTSITLATSTRASDPSYRRPPALPSSPVQAPPSSPVQGSQNVESQNVEPQNPESQNAPESQASSYNSAVDGEDHFEKFADLRASLSRRSCKQANCKALRKVNFKFKTKEQADLAIELLSGDHYAMVDPCCVQNMDLFTMTMNEYLASCESGKHRTAKKLRLYRAPLRFVPYQGPDTPVPIDPYWLGFWLGDGKKDSATVTSADMEIKLYIQSYIDRLNRERPAELEPLHLHELVEARSGEAMTILGRETRHGQDAFRWSISSGVRAKGNWNPVYNALRDLGLLGDKSGGIPDVYMNTDNEETRLAVLAGLIESDGNLVTRTNCYKFTQNTEEHRKIVEDARKLAISCGIHCTNIAKYPARSGSTEFSYVFHMSKGTEKFQHLLLLPRKRLDLSSFTRNNRDVRNFEVEDAGQGEYRRIDVSGGLYQLADRTVVHNCAVNSEHKKNVQNDQWRFHQLEKSLSNPKHPYCHFSTGNLEILKIQPESRGVNVRKKFIEFYNKHYSANRMKLVVLGREPLDVLESWVSDLFTDIPDKNLPPNRWEDEVPFGPEQLGMQCFTKPVMETRELNLFFPFFDEEPFYESQPSRYISHLIGHEGPGSIMSYIKSKGWANGLSAGAYPVCPGTPGIFDCQVRLTEEGLKNYKEVVKVFFQYVSLLRESPPHQWIFEEQKGLADVDFKFKQKTPASRFTSRISSVMQKPLPREWLLSGHSRLRKFDPELIKKGIERLRPDNFRMTLVSKEFPGNWDSKEKWYGTEYRYEQIPKDFMEEIRQAASATADQRISRLHLPHKNQFIPTKLEVEKKDVTEPSIAPRIIRRDDLLLAWWKKDDTFWVPKANLIVSCKSPIIYATAQNSVKARLYTDLVRDALEEYSYDAELAGLQYSVSMDIRGLSIEVSGYNDKLPVLLEQVLATMRDLEIKEDRFEIVKERLSRAYRNWAYQQPYHQLSDYTSWLTSENDFVVEELVAELHTTTVKATQAFKYELLSQLHMEVYVHGNFYKEDVLRLTDMIETTLKPRVLPRAQWPILRSLIYPPGSNYSFEKQLKDPQNVNHAIEYLLYVGDKADRGIRAKTLLLDQITQEPAFDQLRTKEQLGYVVFSGVRGSATTYSFRFIIQSEKTPRFLESRIEAFLTSFGKVLEDMNDADFESQKRSLVNKRLEKLKNLDQETARHWNQIHTQYYDFDFAQQDATAIRQLSKADLIEFFKHYIDPVSKARAKLVVYLVAQAKSDVSTGQISELVKTLSLDSELARQAATDLQARLSAAHHDHQKEMEELKSYLLKDLRVAEDKIEAAAAAWEKLSKEHRTNGVVADDESLEISFNGTSAVPIKDVRELKCRLLTTGGATPVRDLSVYEDLDPKL